ncbi:hypothetical protein FISHEDRAFT_42751, partial [Fistulina hepatica ATCC 64428]
WYPWEDKITCTLDILVHLPRSVFSRRQLDLFLWLLKVNGVDDVPTPSSLKRTHVALQKICGVRTLRYDGVLGNPYYVNSLGDLIAQEMSNPRVRPYLHFYPEDAGVHLSEARQADRWLRELDNDALTPMAELHGHRFFTYELAKLTSGEFCMPVRWFTRRIGSEMQLFAKCWRPISTSSHMGQTGWIVYEDDWEVPLADFMFDWKRLCERFEDRDAGATPWTFSNPAEGNRWRVRSQGHRVYTFPIWMYCDDTSGNMSKRWNEHNSFLFIPAGLPRLHAQREYNIHFLSTSNTAPPLEMLDGIVDQLERLEREGVWAWDCVHNAPVLIFPTVLALLGDNPMQSEFACHIGLRGRMFCRSCYVSGKVEGSDDSPFSGPHGDRTPAATASSSQPPSRPISPAVSEYGSGSPAASEADEDPGKRRTKQETTAKLRSYFTDAQVVNTKTKIRSAQTECGKLFGSYAKTKGKEKKQQLLDSAARHLPSMKDWRTSASPVWRIKGLDPHRDTPVEVLHVVLLGFVKYFWRDAINNQIGKDDAKRELLKTRLNCLDVEGLGLDGRLSGHTLVQYAGSLTGSDFRIIAQVAPFVLHNLVSGPCYATWISLSKLVPMIWQPEIPDINDYKVRLREAVNHFLLTTAAWNCRWFFKPKFHIITHLPDHVPRFGPPMLFATEAFESFNAVIRGKSIHSNRQAPSRDIALAFAQCNRVRHILSQGLFLVKEDAEDLNPLSVYSIAHPNTIRPFSFDAKRWRRAGDGPTSLVQSPNTVTEYLDLSMHHALTSTSLSERRPVWLGKHAFLLNGDRCSHGSHVVLHDRATGQLQIAKVLEIFQYCSPIPRAAPDGFLVQLGSTHRKHDAYDMPCIDLRHECHVASLQDILCTVNVQHNCATHMCTNSGTARVYQERQTTAKTRSLIEHRTPADIVLNTGQMRDAVHLSPFVCRPAPLDEDMIIHNSAAQELLRQSTVVQPSGSSAKWKAPPQRRPQHSGGSAPSTSTAPSSHPRIVALRS